MLLIPEALIEQVRDRVDVVAVIGRHVELKRSGRTWKGCCVFHGERTPSFHVYPEDKHFKCYGCGAYGDVFSFLQRLEGKEFPEVVKALAQEVGVEIPEAAEEDSAEARRRRKERNEVLAACDAAARYWAARLQSRFGAQARRYLEERGIGEEAIRRFRIGISADGWGDLVPRVAEKGIGPDALLRAGLLVEKEKGGAYDRFRNRLMFPIAGMDGQVIGFGGRVMPGEASDKAGAKYINTPETPLYKKSKVLYGLELARESIRKTRTAVLVEGYFDVIGLHQAGIANAVAVCGTALTAEHVELLGRCDCREVTILFDGDVAGLAAPAKAAAALFPAGVSGKVALLPSQGGKTDPDEYARAHGRAGMEALLAKATPLSEHLIDRAVERACGGAPRDAALEAKLAAVRELTPFVRMMPEGLARSVFEDAIAKRLDLDLGALRAELEGEQPRRQAPARPEAAPVPPRPPARTAPTSRVKLLLPGPAADALGLLVAFPAELAGVAEEEGLPGLMPPGPLAELARDLIREPMPLDAALARVRAAGDEDAFRRVRDIVGPARPPVEGAVTELRKAAVKSKLERLGLEMGEAEKRVARAGSASVDDLSTRYQRLVNQKRDLQRRLQSLERSG
ncbi:MULTISPECIES: DNA primase [unclassified Anaeromyxobacter]|uniref:DNA primase n=1 Tax=unclassified Anaeromyxobacter TaxID=2620896 RepID=UPI001F5AAA70|nr:MULTISPECIES: DNA primase [unclassified Anaeromyxobacter]